MNRRVPFSLTSTPAGLPRRQAAEFVAAAARVFRTSFPNPDRSGCPGQQALQAAARKTVGPESEAVLEHLTCCSPCFGDYERLVRSERLAKNLKVLALCASLLITISAAIWFYALRTEQARRTPEPTIVQQEPSTPQARPETVEMAVDLRNRAPVRGEQLPRAGETIVASLSARRTDLSLYLPVGSEEGDYEVQVVGDGGLPVVSLRGPAAFEDGKVVLRVHADLRGLAAGRYSLGVRKGDARWTYYPIAVVH